VTYLALRLLDFEDPLNYDRSWREWAKDAEAPVEPAGEAHGAEQHDVLDRAERADPGAEAATGEEREGERQHEEQEDSERKRVGRVEQPENHVLRGAHRADTALAVEAEVDQTAHA